MAERGTESSESYGMYVVHSCTQEHEEFYGIGSQDDLHVSEHLSSSDSDEDELGGTDTESEAAPRAFDAQSETDEIMIRNMGDDHMRQGCGCSCDCYKQFTDDEVFQIRLQMQELEKSQRDFVLFLVRELILALATHTRHLVNASELHINMRMTTVFCVNQLFVSYIVLEKKSSRIFTSISKDNGIIPREHGNKGRLPPNAFTFDTTKNIVDFITNYATVFGLPQPAARGRASTAPVFLPASEGYN